MDASQPHVSFAFEYRTNKPAAYSVGLGYENSNRSALLASEYIDLNPGILRKRIQSAAPAAKLTA